MEATLPSDSPQLHSPGAPELKLLMVFFSALYALEHQARPELFKKKRGIAPQGLLYQHIC